MDDALTLVTNIFLLLPGLPLLIILAAFLPPGTSHRDPGARRHRLGGLGPGPARAGQVDPRQGLRGRRASSPGSARLRIMFREILPNMASVVMTTLLGCVIFGIGAQAGLEFLGLGDSSVVSWGTNLYWASNDGALMTGAWWAFVPSGLCIALVAFALALVNYAVDEITNPRLRSRRARRVEKEGLSHGTPIL